DRVESLAVSPDGRWAVATHSRSLRYQYDNRIRPVTYLHDLRAGKRKAIFQEPKFNLEQVDWARDGKGFYVANQFTTHPRYVMATVTELYYFDLATESAVRVNLGWQRGLSSQWENGDHAAFHVTADGFVALLADGARNRAARYTRVGMKWQRADLAG